MGLATAGLVLITIPVADTTHNPIATVQIVSGLALLFTVAHIAALAIRSRDRGIVIGAGAASLALGSATTFEWLLLALLARPMLAVVLVLTELPSA